MYLFRHCSRATRMWCWAILFPTPREPLCRNSQHVVVLVHAHLDEVVPRPESTQLQAHFLT